IVIILDDFVEAELLVVIRADPFGCIDSAFFQGRIDIAARDLLGNGAELGKGLASPSTDPHLETAEVLNGVDLLAEPAAHLSAGVTTGDAVQTEFLAEVIEHVLAAVILEPSILLTRIQPERYGAIKREGRVLADEVISSSVTHLDSAIAQCIDGLQGRN